MRLLARFVLVLALAGCSRIEPLFSPTGGTLEDVSKLSGRFTGAASFSTGPDFCQRSISIGMTVLNGRVQGEMRDPRTPNAAPSRFEGFIGFDGGMAVAAYALGSVLILRGRFLETRFNGTLVPEASVTSGRNNPREGESNLRFGFAPYCGWNVRLTREAG